MPMPCTKNGEWLIIELPERMVMADAPGLRAELKGLIQGGDTRLVLDLSAVEFADSSGLSVLISALNAAREAQGEVHLLKPNKQIQSLLELTRLHHVFQIFDSADAATSAV